MRKVSLFLAAFCLACVVPAFAGLAQPAAHITLPTPILDQPHWRTFTSQEGEFSVLFPSAPASRTTATAIQPAQGPTHYVTCQTGSGNYLIQYFDVPAVLNSLTADQEFATSERYFLRSTPGTILSKKSFAVNGYPCHETVVQLGNGSKEFHRLYRAGLRRYSLFALQTPAEAKADPTSPVHFLDSFTIRH